MDAERKPTGMYLRRVLERGPATPVTQTTKLPERKPFPANPR